ncbi:MAG TPA: hypothetical protein VJN18_24325 [Polyangiaceae bacterium]|nr:hypothetical protein [Polyangiaceae bacterium]
MSTTADAAAREGFSGNYGAPAPDTEVGAELQARLADTEARLADALNRLSFREAELAAFAPEGATPPRRAVLMARVAELEQASEGQESELQDLRSIAKAREAELGKTKAKLKALEKSAKLREADLVQTKAKLKALEKSTKVRETELVQAKTKPKALEAALEQVRSTGLWKVARKSMLAAGKSLGIASKRRKGRTERENLRRHIELLAASGLFDRNWYLAAYPDVARAGGIDPAQHYLRYGADEGRDPGPRFSTRKYLKRYPDVARAGMNPLLHYLEFGLDEQRAIFAANRNVAVATASAVKLPKRPTLEPEPALGAATVFSLPPVRREEAAWIRHEALCRREGRTTLELHGTILGWLPSSAQTVGTDSFASLPVIGAAALFCRMMRLGDAKGLGCFEADAEFALPPADLQGAPLGRHFLPNPGPIDLADAWFASARDLRLRFARPTPVLRFFQWDRHAGKVVLLSEAHVQTSNGLADIPTVNPLLPILVAASDAEGVLEGLFLLPFPSLCRGGCHHGELLAGEGGSLMERFLAISTALAEAWLTGDREAFTIGRIDVDLANARGSEIIFSRAVQLWLDSCFDVRCRPINGAAIADERVRLYLEERLRGVADKAEGLSERERSASYALQIGAGAIPSLQAIVARGAPPVGSAGLGASILVDGATGKPRWLLDLARLDAGLLESLWTDGAPSPKVIPLRERASQADHPAAIDAAHGFALALTACNDGAARVELFVPTTRLAKSGRAIRNPSAQPEISVLCPYGGDERRFAAFLDSLRLQTNVTNLEVIVTAASGRTESGASLEAIVRRFFPDGKVIPYDDEMLPGTRLNLMAERARCDLLLVAAGVLLHDPSTLDVLRHIAEDEKAATASCVLRGVAAAGAAGPAHLHCAGFYPDGKEEPRGVVATFARIDSPAPLGSGTYPIAANPPPLFMTRKTTWRKLGGFNETLSELATVAIDFAVRATTRGDVHLCTSALSATVIDEAIAVTPRTISLPSATPPLAWRDAAARSVVVRTLVP